MIQHWLREKITEAVKQTFPEVELPWFEIEKPKKEEFGDYATNVALVLTRKVGKPPMDIASQLKEVLEKGEHIKSIEVAKPGFINFRIKEEYYFSVVKEAISLRENFGRSELGKGKRVIVEFVSANPTGPLHIGHGRGAAYGDTLARLLSFAGYEVIREYYINDYGTQMNILGRSVWLRAKELNGEKIDFPEDHYKGAYIYDIAKEALKRYPDLLSLEEEKAIKICTQLAKELILEDIKRDLENFRVSFDNWFSETSLYEEGKVEALIDRLKEKGLIYEKDGALWFKSSEFGDEKDRVVRRSTGDYTYFAGDIAYHYNKFVERRFDLAINLWGADHHGYVKRLKSAVKALGINEDALKVLLIQMVNLIEKGEKKSMSTRQGEFVELKELIKDVGVDPTRFIFLSRSSDAPLDFDVELAKKQSQENPVYYVQYAHARICSVFRKAKEAGIEEINWDEVDFSVLNLEEELKLLKRLEEFKEVVENSAQNLVPYRITYFLLDLARDFHEYYTKHRILGQDEKLTYARLGLCEACRVILKNGLNLLGVSAPEKM
ncbi:MAG: arginine--tRNA ligase [Thermodesulfobacteria bacterium]|nr:arginine--tRNA ligase [Thermodesulfobacteriota bacterium]